MDLDRLRLFVAILEEGSLTGAARVHHVTQPAASRSLRLLEEGFGVELFERVGRGLEITAAGRALVPKAYEMLRRAEQVEQEVRQAAREGRFNFMVGTTDSVATYLLPGIVAPVRAGFPALMLQWGTGRSRDLLEQVRAGELDCVIVASSSAPAGKTVRRLGPYTMGYYGRRDLFGQLEEVKQEQGLEPFPVVEIHALPGQPSLIGEHTPSFAKVSSLATVKAMVLGGFGIGSLLGFMLSPQERACLVRAPIVHDPDCALYLVVADHFCGATSQEIVRCMEASIVRALGEEGGVAGEL